MLDGKRAESGHGESREPPYWRDALRSFLRTLGGFALAGLLATVLTLAYYGVVA